MGNVAFTWSLKKQSIMMLSTCKAKYAVTTSCVCHALWMRNMLKNLHLIQKEATQIFIDNRLTLGLLKNLVFYDRRKHIHKMYYFRKECIAKNEVKLKFVKSQDHIADIFTHLGVCIFHILKALLEVTKIQV
jgi:hypothetical protein